MDINQPQPAKRVRNIDGILPKPTKPVYKPPAGPLHVQYLPKAHDDGHDTRPVAMQPVRPKTFADVRPVQPQPKPKPVRHVEPIELVKPGHRAHPVQPKPLPASDNIDTSKIPDQDADEAAPSAPTGRQKFSWEGRKAERSLPVGRIVIGLVIAGLSLFSLELGQLALAVYAIVAIWKRWPSQQTFILALAMFGGIIIASLFEPYRYVAENLAVYAFLLLCIGTVSLALEVRRDSRR